MMFQIQALDTDSTKGGSTKGGWQSCLAYCCRGRVLAAQGKGRDAAGAFEAAVADAVRRLGALEAAEAREGWGSSLGLAPAGASECAHALASATLAVSHVDSRWRPV